MAQALIRQFGVKDNWQSSTWESNAFLKRSTDNRFLSIDWDAWPASFDVTAPNTYIHEVASPGEDIFFPQLTMTNENFHFYWWFATDYWSYGARLPCGEGYPAFVPRMWTHPSKPFGFAASLTLVRQWPSTYGGTGNPPRTKKLAWNLVLGLWGCHTGYYYLVSLYKEITDLSAASPVGEFTNLVWHGEDTGGEVGNPRYAGPYTVIATP